IPSGRAFASAVERHDGGLSEGGGVKGARGMGDVVLDKVPTERPGRRHADETFTQMMRYAIDQMAGGVDDGGQEEWIPGRMPSVGRLARAEWDLDRMAVGMGAE